MRKRGRFYLLAIFLILAYFSLIFSLITKIQQENSNQNILGQKTLQEPVEISVFIGEHRFTLFGYTSPYALVTFSGLGIFDQTNADKNGYFIFKNRFSPFSPREACLTAQDQFGRLTSPVCLPPFPTDYNVEIGPVIMPPTLSLDKNEYWIGDEMILTGQSVPESQINLSFFSQKKSNIFINFLAKKVFLGNVYAQNNKNLQTFTDKKGNFSIKLSSSQVEKLRFFTQVNYDKKISPESRKLTVEILPWWMIIFKFVGIIFLIIKSRLLEFIILGQIIALTIYFLRKYLHPRNLAIVKREGFPILKQD